ncbi:MAG: type II secretion system major pseudopilin GspG [Nitrospirota bacterium]|nr:MAG: type II secretion system major pseudopilin GspG [Nitrospirota bacterium]
MNRRLKCSGGFSLIEVLIVLVIISLILGLVGPRVFKGEKKGKILAAKSQIELFGGALDQLRLDTGNYPSSSEGLSALLASSGMDGWDGPYLKKTSIPQDPWGSDYIYRFPGSHGEYDLYSWGPDKQEGTADDIKSWE